MFPEITQPTILIVDDNITNLKITMQHLRAHDFYILTARDGAAGIERARLAQPDLILLDVWMPELDGFETCRRLKADKQTRDIPVIFMTALSSLEDRLQGFAAGGVDYISKPFQVEELLARVNTHLTLYRLQRELQVEICERQQLEAALHKANLELQRLSVLDTLTQVANRRRFHQYLRIQWEQVAHGTLSLLLCVIDDFTSYANEAGNQAGDECLQQVAQAICRAVRHVKDLVARHGGAAFAVILPDTDPTGALRVVEAIQREISTVCIPLAHRSASGGISLSIGAASAIPLQHTDPTSLIIAADAALATARQQGRNSVYQARLLEPSQLPAAMQPSPAL